MTVAVAGIKLGRRVSASAKAPAGERRSRIPPRLPMTGVCSEEAMTPPRGSSVASVPHEGLLTRGPCDAPLRPRHAERLARLTARYAALLRACEALNSSGGGEGGGVLGADRLLRRAQGEASRAAALAATGADASVLARNIEGSENNLSGLSAETDTAARAPGVVSVGQRVRFAPVPTPSCQGPFKEPARVPALAPSLSTALCTPRPTRGPGASPSAAVGDPAGAPLELAASKQPGFSSRAASSPPSLPATIEVSLKQ